MIGLVFDEKVTRRQGCKVEFKTVCVDDDFGHQTHFEVCCPSIDWVVNVIARGFTRSVGDWVADVEEEVEDDSGVELTGTI